MTPIPFHNSGVGWGWGRVKGSHNLTEQIVTKETCDILSLQRSKMRDFYHKENFETAKHTRLFTVIDPIWNSKIPDKRISRKEPEQ